MPKLNYRLASQRLDIGGRESGLQPTLLSGNAARGLRIPGINPYGVNAQYTPIRPVMALDTTFQTAAKTTHEVTQATFAFKRQEATIKQQLAREAFQVAEREAGLNADSTVSEFRKYVEKATNGYTNDAGEHIAGYLDREGKAAVDNYHQYSKDLNEVYKEYLNRLEPSARQKAMLRMTGVLDSALGTAATHRRKQLDVAEKQQRYVEQQNVIREIASNPNAILKVNPVTGMTPKDEFMSKFKDVRKAKVAWANTIVGASELLYQEKGLQAAKNFVTAHKGELSDYPQQLAQLDASLKQWDYQSIVRQNAEITRRHQLETWERQKVQRETAQKLFGEIDSNPRSKLYVDKLVESGQLSVSAGIAYKEKVYGNKKPLNQERYNYWLNRIPELAKHGFPKDKDGKDPSWGFLSDDGVVGPAMQLLIQLRKRLDVPQFKVDYTNIVTQLKPLITGALAGVTTLKPGLDREITNMQNDVAARLRKGDSVDKILQDYTEQYKDNIAVKRLPAPKFSIKPTSLGQINKYIVDLEKSKQADRITDTVYVQQLFLYWEYYRAIQAALKQQSQNITIEKMAPVATPEETYKQKEAKTKETVQELLHPTPAPEKTPEQIAADKAEAEKRTRELESRVTGVPESLLPKTELPSPPEVF